MRIIFLLGNVIALDHTIAFKNQAKLFDDCNFYYSTKNSLPDLPICYQKEFSDVTFVQNYDTQKDCVNFEIVLYQLPYTEYHSESWFPSKNCSKTLYNGYGLQLSNWEYGHYQLDFYNDLKFIGAHTSKNIDKFKSKMLNPRSDQKLLKTGDYLLFDLLNEFKQSPPQKNEKKFLWATHWTTAWFDDKSGFSRFNQKVLLFFIFFLFHPKSKLIIRPHPLFNIDTSGASKFKKKIWLLLLSLQNVELSHNSFKDDIINSNFLISSGVSILGYFGISGKPLVMFKRDSSLFNEDVLDFVNSLDNAENQFELFIWLYKQNKSPEIKYNFKRVNLISKIFEVQKVSPYKIFRDHLAESLNLVPKSENQVASENTSSGGK